MELKSRVARWVGWLVAAGAMVVFWLTLHPGLPGGDAGELASAACANGLSHPPGYPLHGLMLRLAAAIPLGDVFVRLNLTSVLCTAVALGLVADLVRRWTSRVEPAVFAVALVVAAPLVWQYATTVEVFALHLALVALTGWTLVRLRHTPTAWWGRAFGLSAGLAVTHHHTALFIVVPLVLLEARRWRWWGPGLLLGFLPLALLPVFSVTDTPYSWGDARSIDGFVTHVLRREYGTFRLASREGVGGGLLAFVGEFVRFEWDQAGLVPVLLALPALAWGWARARGLTLAVVAGLVGSLGVFGALTNLPLDDALFREVVRRFFLLPHLVVAVVAAWSASRLLSRRPWALVVAALALVAVGFVRRPSITPGTLERFGEALLDQPPGALVLVQGDLISGVTRALLACRSGGSGLRVIDQQQLTYRWYVERLSRVMPDVVFPGDRWHPREDGAFTLQAFLDANGGRPVVVCGGLKSGDSVTGTFLPDGLCERFTPVGAILDDEAWWASARVPAPVEGAFSPGSWERLAQREAWDARGRRGLFALERAIARGGARVWLERAAAALRDVVAGDPAPSPATWKNLGIAEGRLGDLTAMRRAFQAYLATAPANDPEVPQLRALVEQPGP
jgi:hypothetical protein